MVSRRCIAGPKASWTWSRTCLSKASAPELAPKVVGSNIRHDLCNPPNAIIGYPEIVLEDAEDLGLDVLIPDLSTTHELAVELLERISSIVDFSDLAHSRGRRREAHADRKGS